MQFFKKGHLAGTLVGAISLAFPVIAETLASPANAQVQIPATYINEVRTGWNADSFAIIPDGAVSNPANCPSPDGYISDKSLPGYNTYYSAALTAFQTYSLVEVTVANSQCFAGRPVLIGINLKHPPSTVH